MTLFHYSTFSPNVSGRYLWSTHINRLDVRVKLKALNWLFVILVSHLDHSHILYLSPFWLSHPVVRQLSVQPVKATKMSKSTGNSTPVSAETKSTFLTSAALVGWSQRHLEEGTSSQGQSTNGMSSDYLTINLGFDLSTFSSLGLLFCILGYVVFF